jgi:hypothetical protein
VDEALIETFPASDPAAKTVATGIRVKVDSPGTSEVGIRAHREASRSESSDVAGDHRKRDEELNTSASESRSSVTTVAVGPLTNCSATDSKSFRREAGRFSWSSMPAIGQPLPAYGLSASSWDGARRHPDMPFGIMRNSTSPAVARSIRLPTTMRRSRLKFVMTWSTSIQGRSKATDGRTG